MWLIGPFTLCGESRGDDLAIPFIPYCEALKND